MVSAPHVDDLVEAANGKFIAVIGDVGGKIGVEAVGPAQHVVLQLQAVNLLLALALGAQGVGQNPGGGQPQGAVLLVGVAPVGEGLHGVGHIAAVVEGGLEEPLVVPDAVALQVGFHLGDVAVQAEAGQVGVAPGLIHVHVGVAVDVVKGPGQVADVLALVAVLGEGHGVLPQNDLEIPGLQTLGKLLDLVAGVVDVELPPHVGAVLGQHGGQGVTQHAAPGVAHVHGAGGVGGHELHHDLLPLQAVVGAVVHALRLNGGHGVTVPAAAQAEIQKAGAGDGHLGEIAAVQIHLPRENGGHFPWVLLHGLGGGQAVGGGVVAVAHVLGHLHRGHHRDALGQQALRHRGAVGVFRQVQNLLLGALHHVHIVSLSSFKAMVRCISAAELPP